MAFDIDIDLGNKENTFCISLEFNDFNILFDAIKNTDNFALLKRCLANYFGDSEIYLNELIAFRKEVIEVSSILENTSTSSIKKFLVKFLTLIEIAISKQKCIKFWGD